MRILFWLIVLMDITLMGLLWLYIFDLYVRAPFDGLSYTGRIYNSDAAIPIIGLGVLLNTGAALFVADRVTSLKEGVALAAEVLDDGRAAGKLEDVRAFGRDGEVVA